MEGRRWHARIGFALALLGSALIPACGISTDAPTGQNQGAGSTELRIKNLKASSITDTEAAVEWSTSRSTVGTFIYGRSSDLQVTMSVVLNSSREEHEVQLEALVPQTTYYYRVAAISTRGDTASARGMFVTLRDQELYDTTAPVISEIQVVGVTSSSAEIHWKTDDKSRGRLYYGLTEPLTTYATEFPGEPTRYERTHQLVLTDLQDATTYSFAIQATNKANLTATTETLQFTTLSKPTISICPATIDVAPGAEFDLGICLMNAQDISGIALVLQVDPTALEIMPNGNTNRDSREGPDWTRTGGHILSPMRMALDPGHFGLEATWVISFSGDTALGTQADGDFEFYTLHCKVLKPTGDHTVTILQGYLPADPERSYPSLYDHHRLSVAFNVQSGLVRIHP